MKRNLKWLFALLLYKTRLGHLVMKLRFGGRRKILVVLYHQIREPRHLFEPSVSPKNFESHLNFLKENFHVIPLEKALHFQEKQTSAKKPLAVITFDDGYKDNQEVALPILERLGLPATFFLAVGSIGNIQSMWTSHVESLFRKATGGTINLEKLDPPLIVHLGAPQERMKACFEVKRKMKTLPDTHRQAILEEIQEKLGVNDENEEAEMLSWEDVRLLAKNPLVTLGSHSVTHRMLANLPSEQIEQELSQSKSWLEKEISKPVLYLSYPGNSYNGEVKQLTEKAGYRAAFAVDQGPCDIDKDNFKLKRIHVEDGPLPTFLAQITVLPYLRSLLPSFP